MTHDHNYQPRDPARLACTICGFTVPTSAIPTCATCGRLMPGQKVYLAGTAYCRMSCLPKEGRA